MRNLTPQRIATVDHHRRKITVHAPERSVGVDRKTLICTGSCGVPLRTHLKRVTTPNGRESHPCCWTVTSRTKEMSARSKARGRSYGFSDPDRGSITTQQRTEGGEHPGLSVSLCMPETTKRHKRCNSMLNCPAPTSTTREIPCNGKANKRSASNLLESGIETERLCPPLSAPHNHKSTSPLLKNFTRAGWVFLPKRYCVTTRHFPISRSANTDQTALRQLTGFFELIINIRLRGHCAFVIYAGCRAR